MKSPAQRKAASRSDVRLLPAVAGVAAILLCLKAGGLAFDASAATAPAPAAAQKAAAQPAAAPTPPPATPVAAASPTDPLAAINSAMPIPANKPTIAAAQTAAQPPAEPASDAGVSQAEMDVLTSLAGRRGALEDRQKDLDLKASVLAAAEKRVDDKIAQLKGLQAQIETTMGQRDAKETQQIDGLVRIYSAMKPKDAARIFASLDGDVRINVAGRMKADAMAGILAALPSDVAQRLTVELAKRYIAPAAAVAANTTPPAPIAAPPAPKP